MKIHVDAKCVWDTYLDNMEKLQHQFIQIAENQEFGVSVELTASKNCGIVMVMVDNDCISETEIYERTESERVVSDIYDKFITGDVMSNLMDAEYENKNGVSQDDMIDERELDLDDAIYDMLSVFLDNDASLKGNGDKIVSCMKDTIAETLYKKFNISIYRPMHLVDEDGNESFEEFPYPDLDI